VTDDAEADDDTEKVSPTDSFTVPTNITGMYFPPSVSLILF